MDVAIPKNELGLLDEQVKTFDEKVKMFDGKVRLAESNVGWSSDRGMSDMKGRILEELVTEVAEIQRIFSQSNGGSPRFTSTILTLRISCRKW